jgi:capsular exopolysaccharide synthesis family protein
MKETSAYLKEASTFSIEFHRYVSLLWHWSWLIVLTTALAGGAAYYRVQREIPLYRATTLVMVNEAPANRNIDYTTMMTSERLAQTYAELLTTRPVLEAVAERLGLDQSTWSILDQPGSIQAKPLENTQLMKISVVDTDPVRAALVANTLVAVFAEQNLAEQASSYAASKQNLESQMAQLDQQIQTDSATLGSIESTPENQAERDQINGILAQYRQTYADLMQSYEQVRLAEVQNISNIIQKEPAIPPGTPFQPVVFRTTMLGALLGLFLGVGMIVLFEALDDTIKDPEEIAHRFGLPFLGMIATHEAENEGPIAKTKPRSPITEAFRSLRTNIQFTSVDRPVQSILITSPSPKDGKSTVAANLSVVFAQSDRRVVLIDADLHRPKQHTLLGVSNRRGLSELFTQPVIMLNGNLRETNVPNLSVLTSGSLPPNPAELLGSDKMLQILSQVNKQAEIIVIDSPPLMAVTDAAVLSSRADGVLLVIRPSVTKLQACKQTIEQLNHLGANVLGYVLNEVNVKKSGYKYTYYYKQYYDTYRKYHKEEDTTDPNTQTHQPGKNTVPKL